MTLSAVVLISGNGSNLQAIIDAIQLKLLPLKICAVISNNPAAFGLKRAKSANIPTEIIIPSAFENRLEFDAGLSKSIQLYKPELIILAGFMRILGNEFLTTFKNKVVNIHPSLLPKYPGLKTHELAIADKLQVHGCTIHFVNQNLDAGPIIAQAEIKISPEETVEKLKDRVHKAEHFLYPTVLKWFAQGRVQLKNDQVLIDQIKIPKNGLKFVLNI